MCTPPASSTVTTRFTDTGRPDRAAAFRRSSDSTSSAPMTPMTMPSPARASGGQVTKPAKL